MDFSEVDMSYSDDKRELLKLKQGIIEESETIKEQARPEKYEVHGIKKVENFFYHYGVIVLVITLVTALVGFLVYQHVTKPRGDAKVLIVADDSAVYSSLFFKQLYFENALESYTKDYDENGYVHVDAYLYDMSGESYSDSLFANQQKLYAELSLGEGQMLIGNREMLDWIKGEDDDSEEYFINLRERYPDSENIVDNCYYQIKGTTFSDALNYEISCPEDLYIVIIRKYEGFTGSDETASKCRERALEIMDNIVSNNVVTVIEE